MSINNGLKGVNVMESNIVTAQNVKAARCNAHLTQSELGDIIGKSKQWVSEVERGNIRLSFDMAVQISDACHTTLASLSLQKSI
jgi:putative transcriptional regulator